MEAFMLVREGNKIVRENSLKKSCLKRINEQASSEDIAVLKTTLNAAANRVSLRRNIPSLRIEDVQGDSLGDVNTAYISFDMLLFVKEKGADDASTTPIRINVEFSPCEGYTFTYYTIDTARRELDTRLRLRLAYHNENYKSDACKDSNVSYLLSDELDHDLREIMYEALDYGMTHDWFDRYATGEFMYVDKPVFWR